MFNRNRMAFVSLLGIILLIAFVTEVCGAEIQVATPTPLALVADFTGDGTDDIKLQNKHMWIMIDGDISGQTAEGAMLMWIFEAGIPAGANSISKVYSPNFIDGVFGAESYSIESFAVRLTENSAYRATCQVVKETQVGSKKSRMIYLMSLASHEPFVRLTHVFTNTGSETFRFQEPGSHIGYGHQVGMTEYPPSGWKAFVPGYGVIDTGATAWTNYPVLNESAYAVHFNTSANMGILHGYFAHCRTPFTHGMTSHPGYGVGGLSLATDEYDVAPGEAFAYQGVWSIFPSNVDTGR